MSTTFGEAWFLELAGCLDEVRETAATSAKVGRLARYLATLSDDDLRRASLTGRRDLGNEVVSTSRPARHVLPGESRLPTAPKILVIGGGVVGSACAYYLTLAGADVTLVERTGIAAEASGASHGFIDWAQGLSRGTLDFVYESVQLLKVAAKDLDDFSLTLDGYLMVALNAEEIPSLRRRYEKAREADLDVRWFDGPAVREFEPALSADIVAALYMPDSGHVDPRRMTVAFARGAERGGAQVISGVEIT
ncbi:MAG TPA: FAD-dependent oxidoreductase, partial [Gaiellales bacterium]|nr:FAD-dependent oxidoreductase [Gaiellales bacterium]